MCACLCVCVVLCLLNPHVAPGNHHQDLGAGLLHHKAPSFLLPCQRNTPLPLPKAPAWATSNLFSIPATASFQECYIKGITQHIILWDWLFPLGPDPLSSFIFKTISYAAPLSQKRCYCEFIECPLPGTSQEHGSCLFAGFISTPPACACQMDCPSPGVGLPFESQWNLRNRSQREMLSSPSHHMPTWDLNSFRADINTPWEAYVCFYVTLKLLSNPMPPIQFYH